MRPINIRHERAFRAGQTRWKASRRADPNPAAGWTLVDLDVTVVSPLAASYVDTAATNADTVADKVASRKTENRSTLS